MEYRKGDSVKAGFQNKLDYCLRDDSDTIWVVGDPLRYWSEILNCMVEIPSGFQSDGSSVPRLPFVYLRYGGRSPREGFVHDYLFRKNSAPVVPFCVANSVFKEAMDSRDKPFDVRWGMYLAVCVGGYPSYHKKSVEDSL